MLRTKKSVETPPPAPSQKAVDGEAEVTTPSKPPRQGTSRLPAPLQFPLIVVLSFALTSLGYSSLDGWTDGELATIARTLETGTEVATLFSWRICELALGWYGKYDSYDLAALNLLSHAPTLYLMSAFYGIRPATALTCVGIDVTSSFLPFLLLRPLSGAHAGQAGVPNREIIVDRSIQAATALLAGIVYSVTLFLACQSFLPRALVLYFAGIPSVEPARAASFAPLPAGVLTFLLGLAARTFIFTPYAAAGPSAADAEVARFDPVSATLGQTLMWNVWGYRTQTKVVILRTAVVMLVTAVSVYLQCSMTINGVEGAGAAIYASIWVLGTLFAGIALGAVGRD